MTKFKKNVEGESVDPLCVFCLSPRFSIGKFSLTTSRNAANSVPLAPSRRLDSNFLISASKRKLNRKKSSATFNKSVIAGEKTLVFGNFSCITGTKLRSSGNNKRRKTLSIEDILKTVQSVWCSPEHISVEKWNSTMEGDNKYKKPLSNECSPILLRRRLSAPETVMRKHLLAHERSYSQDSKNNHNYKWEDNVQSCSDPNLLSRKKDSNFMRKSTLLRRLFGNAKQKLPGSFHEWQHTYGKLSSTQSLNSCHSSPERSRRSTQMVSNSPKKISPKKMNSINNNVEKLPSKNLTMVVKRTSSVESASNSNNNSHVPPLKLISQDSNNRSSSTTKYTYSSFTTYSDNSDSAYTNSISNNHNSNTMSSSISTKRISDASFPENRDDQEAKTQDVTNLNVISNIKLSQKTLDVIFTQIMQDVHTLLLPGEISINTATVSTDNPSLEISNKVPRNENYPVDSNANLQEDMSAKVENSQPEKAVCDSQSESTQTSTLALNSEITPKKSLSENSTDQIQSFFLKSDEDVPTTASAESERIKNYILSNIESGSTYIKPSEDPAVVPRFSAIPRTISMEVNTSNGEGENEESDSASFVDSLEDFNSPRIINHDDKPVGRSADIYQLLPDDSKQENKQGRVKKSAAFFIPIEVEKKKEMKSVSELLPVKVRQRLNQRQQRREEKCQQIKAANSFRYLNERISDYKNSGSSVSTQRNRAKPILPKIGALTKRINTNTIKPSYKGNSSNKSTYVTVENTTRKKGSWTNSAKSKNCDETSHILNSNDDNNHDQQPTRIFQKTEIKNSHKRIEILEIMECIEVLKSPKDKSKIPVPVQHTQSRKTPPEKPMFLDTNQTQMEDPKLDQLIANILIDTLNHDFENKIMNTVNSKNVKRTTDSNFHVTESKSPAKQNIMPPKYKQKFDVIPEEMTSLQPSSENAVNNNIPAATELNDFFSKDANENIKFINVESPPLVMMNKDDTSSCSIPKGWITFYTIRKDAMKTPESTSDEGKLDVKPSNPQQTKENFKQKQDSAKSNASYKVLKTEKHEKLSMSSSSEEKTTIQQFSNNNNTRARKANNFQRKSRTKMNENGTEKNSSGEWSVTISGSNNSGQSVPDVEMRLKFPNPNKYKAAAFNQNHSDSGLGEDNSQERNYNFPKIENNRPQINDRRVKTSYNSLNEGLPKIQIKDKRNKKREGSMISSSTSLMIPRQNKASTCRYQLSRPREMYSLQDVPSRISERHYLELVRRFPEILTVTGRSISPERKLMDNEYYDYH